MILRQCLDHLKPWRQSHVDRLQIGRQRRVESKDGRNMAPPTAPLIVCPAVHDLLRRLAGAKTAPGGKNATCRAKGWCWDYTESDLEVHNGHSG